MNLICNAFAYINGFETGRVDIKSDDEHIKEIYLKNSCISLVSAKRINPRDEVALCTNIEPPEWLTDIFEKEHIVILSIPFDYFCFDKRTKWSLAFYKICVLKHLVDFHDYEKICLMDCDTIVNKEFCDLWMEASYGILMYNTFDPYGCQMRQDIQREFLNLFPLCDCRNNEYFAGGEIAGGGQYMQELVDLCIYIYDTMKKMSRKTIYGDEFFWYAIDKLKPGLIIPGNGYYEHYWTYKSFRLISTNFFYKKVTIMHFPVEKDKGLKKIFDYYIHKGRLPEKRILWHLLGLPQPDDRNPYLWTMLSIMKIYYQKVLKKLKKG